MSRRFASSFCSLTVLRFGPGAAGCARSHVSPTWPPRAFHSWATDAPGQPSSAQVVFQCLCS
eukprot:8704418-Pyramimonas_sp.AAC.1